MSLQAFKGRCVHCGHNHGDGAFDLGGYKPIPVTETQMAELFRLRAENADLKSTLHHAAQMEALDKATIAQQAAVIEQTREAFRVASMDTETINRKAPEIAKGCCSMPMPDTEGMYRLANEEVCNVVSSYLYWLHKNQPTALHPSPEILEARDERVAEACAKAVIAYNGQCDAHVLASQLICGEWRKYV